MKKWMSEDEKRCWDIIQFALVSSCTIETAINKAVHCSPPLNTMDHSQLHKLYTDHTKRLLQRIKDLK